MGAGAFELDPKPNGFLSFGRMRLELRRGGIKNNRLLNSQEKSYIKLALLIRFRNIKGEYFRVVLTGYKRALFI